MTGYHRLSEHLVSQLSVLIPKHDALGIHGAVAAVQPLINAEVNNIIDLMRQAGGQGASLD
jgi:hypothetical protein